MARAIFFILAALVLAYALGGCVTVHVDPALPKASPTPAPVEERPESIVVKLSWGDRDWTPHVVSEVTKVLPTLSKAQDVEKFCPGFSKLSEPKKAWVFSELISAMAKFESSWRPTAWMKEPGIKNLDAVTGLPVTSEGLLQLSYQDSQWYPCAFDWKKDKAFPLGDQRRTILQPKVNLSCGVKILARQIERRKLIVVPSGPYWSVIYEGKNSKVAEIKKMVQALPICKGA